MGCQQIVVTAIACGMTTGMTGCATIVHGSNQSVGISSNPSGADIEISNGVTLTTPSSVKLARNRDYVVTISKEGYHSVVIPLNSVLSGWLAGNIIFGGIIGGGVDLASGAAYTLTPENIHVNLKELKPGESDPGAPSRTLTTVEKLEHLEKLYEDGVLKENEYKASKAKLQEDLKKEITEGGG